MAESDCREENSGAIASPPPESGHVLDRLISSILAMKTGERVSLPTSGAQDTEELSEGSDSPAQLQNHMYGAAWLNSAVRLIVVRLSDVESNYLQILCYCIKVGISGSCTLTGLFLMAFDLFFLCTLTYICSKLCADCCLKSNSELCCCALQYKSRSYGAYLSASALESILSTFIVSEKKIKVENNISYCYLKS